MPTYGAMSAFASCPATTGEAPLHPCPQFPDAAHRCSLPREHVRDMTVPTASERMTHRCTCGGEWACIMAFGDLIARLIEAKRP